MTQLKKRGEAKNIPELTIPVNSNDRKEGIGIKQYLRKQRVCSASEGVVINHVFLWWNLSYLSTVLENIWGTFSEQLPWLLFLLSLCTFWYLSIS